MNSNLSDESNKFLIYQPEDGKTRISVRLEGETVWLTQASMAELFQTTPQNITLHINNIYSDDELLERIRDIRASEKRFYRKITDIYSLSVDYAPKAEVTQQFFATVQNKLHWAIHGHTAAELISERVDADKPHMGLTIWKGAKVRKRDVGIAKNYLTEDEIRGLNRIVTMYLDYAEDQAERHHPMTMRDWREKLDAFLQFNQRDVLGDAGTVSAEVAKALAEAEHEKVRVARLTQEAQQPDEFDRMARQLMARNEGQA